MKIDVNSGELDLKVKIGKIFFGIMGWDSLSDLFMMLVYYNNRNARNKYINFDFRE